MRYRDTLLWILDSEDGIKDDEEYRRNIDFVHSLGLKCDSVGWCRIELDRPDTPDILRRIEEFCRNDGWSARGWFTRTLEDAETDWYEVNADYAEDIADYTDAEGENGISVKMAVIRAFKEVSRLPRIAGDSFIVPARVREACEKNGVTDVRFCWVQDKGKYAAEQYFAVYPDNDVGHVACDHRYNTAGMRRNKQDSYEIAALGGMLPRIAELFADLNIILPNQYPARELPAAGFAIAYRNDDDFTKRELLIHRSTAEMLIREKALSRGCLTPVLTYTEIPAGYFEEPMWTDVPCPTQEYTDSMEAARLKLEARPRPIWLVSEKEAVRLLRKARAERKEDFCKALPRGVDPGEQFAPMTPYWRVANGGYLSDEYELLPYERTAEESAAFAERAAMEETVYIPEGIVIAVCADGDRVLLCGDGTVVRVSHEDPTIQKMWRSAAEFVAEAVEE